MTCGRGSLSTSIASARLCLVLSFVVSLGSAPTPPLRPNNVLTPGVIGESRVSVVCQTGYSKMIRHTPGSLKAAVYSAYGFSPKTCGHCEIDHRIPLELGGADVKANLWPESYDTEPWNARTKDHLENLIRRKVCREHSLSLAEGQEIFKKDWIEQHNKYIGSIR